VRLNKRNFAMTSKPARGWRWQGFIAVE